MNYIIVFIVFIFSFFGYSQKIENGVINYDILESEIIKQINEHRKNIGIGVLSKSKVVNQEITSKHALLNAKSDLGFHPKYDRTNKVINEKIYKEICVINKVSELTLDMLDMNSYAEILNVFENYELSTYQEFASISVKAWLNSPPHKKTIESNFTNVFGFSGLISCSVKKSITGKYYIFVNFVNLTYIKF